MGDGGRTGYVLLRAVCCKRISKVQGLCSYWIQGFREKECRDPEKKKMTCSSQTTMTSKQTRKTESEHSALSLQNSFCAAWACLSSWGDLKWWTRRTQLLFFLDFEISLLAWPWSTNWSERGALQVNICTVIVGPPDVTNIESKWSQLGMLIVHWLKQPDLTNYDELAEESRTDNSIGSN